MDLTQLVVHPPWREAHPDILHGFLPRAATPRPGRLPLAELAADCARRLECAGESPGAWNLAGADQVHGDRVAVIGADASEVASSRAIPEPEPTDFATGFASVREASGCDALVTADPGVLLAIRTADCVPILLHDAEAGVVGACHCGWRGLFENLTAVTVAAMTRLGARPASVAAWIGPCIRAENYEVGGELLGKFASRYPDVTISPDGTRLDLAALTRAQLLGAGVPETGIGDSEICTFADAGRCHSWRRDGEAAGRTLTMIGIRG